MELRLALRGLGAGALGGLLAFVFARILAEPQINAASDYERGRDAALHTADGPELFSRSIQQNVGVGVGMILFGLAMGGLLAVAFVVVSRTLRPRVSPRVLGALIAAAGFLGLYLLPFLKYPANPPAIGHEDTIRERSGLYLAMVAISLVALAGAVLVQRRLTPRLGSWFATLAGVLALGAMLAIATAILPGIHETPQPLTSGGRIVYPGFPADVLFKFRLYSVLSQAILWGTLGFVFGPLAERVLAPAGSRVQLGSMRTVA